MDILNSLAKTLFGLLPEWAQLLVFALLVGGLGYFIARWWWEKWEIKRLKGDLEKVEGDRKKAQDRLDAQDKIGAHVWQTPPRHHPPDAVPMKDRKTRFIALCNLKGGVGKTTLTLNLGVGLALEGKQVLLVDLDFQGTLSNLAIQQDSLNDLRVRGFTAGKLLQPGFAQGIASLTQLIPGVDGCKAIIASDKLEHADFEAQARFFLNPENEVRFIYRTLFHTEEILSKYDYVLFDCPPRFSTSCINALVCADYVLIPTTMDRTDVEAVPRTLEWLHRDLRSVVQAQFLASVITQAKMRRGQLVIRDQASLGGLKQLICDQLNRQMGFKPSEKDVVFNSKIPHSPIMKKCNLLRKPAALVDEDAKKWFSQVARELEKRIRQ